MSTVLVGADLCPVEANQLYFRRGDAQGLFHDLLPEFAQADLVIANLECPLIEQPSPIVKTGPVFGAPGECISGIMAAGIDVLCLANNHSLDHGPAGLLNTLAVCEGAGVATVGAGENLTAARRLLIRNVNGIRVGVLAMAEREFSIATRTSAGANPLDLIDFVRNVREFQDQLDYLIVLLHGSAEFHVPTPRIRETCRFMIEMGARAVIVQHPHVLGGVEEYLGGHIVYGQGALIMDEVIYRDRQGFHEGFLVKLEVAANFTSRMELIPFTQSKPAPGARRLSSAEEMEFRQRLEARSRALQDDAFVEAEWRKFCEEHGHGYLSALLGHNRLFRRLNRRGWFTRWFYGRQDLLRAGNTAICETHREAIETIFRQLMD
jgi:poly-gamma-glutamate synthesis protein (capsule biosynthesis protein)